MAASPDESPKEEVVHHQSRKQATPDGDVMVDYIEQLLKHFPRAAYFHRRLGRGMTKRQISYLLPGIPEMNNQYNAPEGKVYQNEIPDETDVREVEVKNIGWVLDLPGGGQIRDTFWGGFFLCFPPVTPHEVKRMF